MSYNGTSKTGASNRTSNETFSKEVSVTSSVITMTVGIVSNILALFIILKAYQRFRMQSKAPFLLFAGCLVLTDFLGHVINGSLALYVHALNKNWESFDPKQVLCEFFGVCMTFFGLSPLLLGAVMAVERCIGVIWPFFHSMALTSSHIKGLLALTWLGALLVALLPVMVQRPYKVQYTESWCFFRLEGSRDWLDLLLPMTFSLLGLLAILITFVCNTVTGFTLLWSRLRQERDYHRHHRSSIHFEMICQLLAIMIVSSVCWGPLLVTVVIICLQDQKQDTHSHLLLTVRLATWNQILEPWVYILLRKAFLKRLLMLVQKCCTPRPKLAFGWRFSALGNSVEARSSVSNRPDFICLDGPCLPDKYMTPTARFP
ncbi:prostaglandin F2-alpha receptor [Hoplias malabaricus]|uniref:prostaglandin F2-alpha receptor n=1 Tax=Hoplias malabaricus TaxID=27720 RepID=UPI003462B62F